MAKRNAFTLAEVLITLGIIGVVAAMTLPTLINSTQAAQFRSQMKKVYTVVGQAMTVTSALDDYDAGQAIVTTYNYNDEEPDSSIANMFGRRLQVEPTSRENPLGVDSWDINNKSGSSVGGSDNYTFLLNDGSSISFPSGATSCTQGNTDDNCKGVIDVNGKKNPNNEVTCENDNPSETDCLLKNGYDIYPILIEPQGFVPRTRAARYQMYRSGK